MTLRSRISFLLLISIGCLAFSNAIAQADYRPGYIISLSGDTTKGFCLFRLGSGRHEGCKFKRLKEGEGNNLLQDSIKGYGFEKGTDFIYESSLNKFIEVLANGKVVLGKLDHKFFLFKEGKPYELLNTSKTMRQPSGELYQYDAMEYRGILTFLLSDCPSLKTKINRTRLDDRPLTQIIYDYNKCTGDIRSSVKRKIKYFTINAGALCMHSSVSITNLSPSTIYSDRYIKSPIGNILDVDKLKKSTFYSYGVFFELIPERLGGKVSLTTEIIFQSAKFSSSLENYMINSVTTGYTFYNEEVKTAKIPLYLKYNFKKSEQKVYPYFYAGVSMNLNHTGAQASSVSAQTHKETFYLNNSFDVSPINFLFLAGIGVRADFGNISAVLTGRYETGKGPFDFSYYGSPNTSTTQNLVSLAGGVSYKW